MAAQDLENLRKTLKDFFTNQRILMAPSGMNPGLKGWHQLISIIIADKKSPPDEITFEQLQKLQTYSSFFEDSADLVDRTHLGKPTVKEYVNNCIPLIATCLNKHPENKSSALLKDFYTNQLLPMQNAIHMVKKLDWRGEDFGTGFLASNAAINKLEAFMAAMEKLDPHFVKGTDPAKYSPDVMACRRELDTPNSALRNPGFSGVQQLLNRLESALGAPVAPPNSKIAPLSFGNRAAALDAVQSRWSAVTEEIIKLKPARAINP